MGLQVCLMIFIGVESRGPVKCEVQQVVETETCQKFPVVEKAAFLFDLCVFSMSLVPVGGNLFLDEPLLHAKVNIEKSRCQ